ncbi:MAG: S1 RNA-binding domain-containing protein, partial [Phycisphaerales bacterium]|nr:S1 RNA-binding domain-containing protein [Phycisphaerales bacterium]
MSSENSNVPESTPAAEPTSTAPTSPAPDAAAAADAKPEGNLKGLPKIAKAEVIRDPSGGGDRGPGNRGPRGEGGGGSYSDRRRDRDKKPIDLGPKAPNTRDTLDKMNRDTDGGNTAMNDATLAAEIDMMMNDAAAMEMPRGKREVKPIGGFRSSGIRGPRKVEAAREHRTGKVVSVGPSDIFVEFGPKELGVVPRLQFPDDQLPTVGGELELVVDRFEAAESLFICSRPGQVQKAKWELLEPGQVVEARVTGANKGGLELEVCEHRAFMPASQVSLDRIEDLSVLVGEKFPVTIVRVERIGAGNIVVSRRDLLAQERKEKAAKLKATLAEGAVMDGIVRKIMPFGAFIDLGGMDGLCHISDMTYDRVTPSEKNVAKFVTVGQAVKVQVLKMDLESNKIALGMKQLSADPFAMATNDVSEGAEVTGRVVRITEFGAFVEIGPGVDGLVHISEVSRKRVAKIEDHLKVDQVVTARVLKIEPATRKISLSIKALLPEEAPAPGSRGAIMAEKNAAKAKMAEERLKEIQKETPELRRQREKFRHKELTGGFGKGMDFLGSGLGGL